MANEMVKYELDNGQAIQVTEQDVRDLLAAGGQIADNVTANEIKAFLRLCQAQRLNPFTRDAYIVKYGNGPATIMTGKEAFTKRAYRNPKFRGMEAGITVLAGGSIQRRDGSLLLPNEQLVGGWCKVYVDGYAAPMFDEVSMAEYSTGKSNWARIPATMIRKVAITHALREAFPEDLGGLYGEEEMSRAVEQDGKAPQQAQAAPLEVRAEVVQDAPKPERPARLDGLRGLMAQAKQLGILVRDKADPNAGLLGWVWATYGMAADELNALSDAQIAEVEAHVHQVIADKQALDAAAKPEPEPEPEEPYEYELADNDIAF